MVLLLKCISNYKLHVQIPLSGKFSPYQIGTVAVCSQIVVSDEDFITHFHITFFVGMWQKLSDS